MGLTVSTVEVAAQSAAADDAKRRVNVSGRQRMLSQRMAKASCFTAIGLDKETHLEMLQGAYNLFSKSHDALRYGDEEVGLVPETYNRIKRLMVVVDDFWVLYGPEIATILRNRDASVDGLHALDAASLKVLVNQNTAVNATARAYGSKLDDLPLNLSISIDVAGRQRMLTQKSSKEFCLILADVDAADNRAKLAKTVNLFDLSLDALINGFPDAGVMAAPNDELFTQLNYVKDLWQEPRSVLLKVAAGEEIGFADPATIARDVEPVLREMNKAVGMYEFVGR